eukprot:scaffold4120_cov400-Prasinococcus_capsulatus_cf.AAC.4
MWADHVPDARGPLPLHASKARRPAMACCRVKQGPASVSARTRVLCCCVHSAGTSLAGVATVSQTDLISDSISERMIRSSARAGRPPGPRGPRTANHRGREEGAGASLRTPVREHDSE